MPRQKYQKQKNGYYQTRVWDGSYENGKKKYITVRSKKSSADLEKKVIAYKEKTRDRAYIKNTDIMFVDYANQWCDLYKSDKATNTIAIYKKCIRYMSSLALVRVQDIDRVHLQTVLNEYADKKRTQQQIQNTFNQILRSAVIDKLLTANVYDDITNNIERVKYKIPEKRALLDHEKRAVLLTDLPLMEKNFLYLLYGCGLRRGEALALTVADINVERHEVTINKSLVVSDLAAEVKEPKTARGNRVVPIPESIIDTISTYVDTLPNHNSYLFTNRNGGLYTKSSYRWLWKRIIKAMEEVAGEPIIGLTAHIFRHNYCSNLCYQIPTISIKKIAQLMGDREDMVLNVYNHMILDKENSEEAINNAF